MKKECNICIELCTDNKKVAVFQQIADGIRQNICSGILRPGDMLPSSRDLARQLGVSRKTIVKATEILLLKGLLVSKDRVGLFVAQPSAISAMPSDVSSIDISPTACADMSATVLKVNDGFPDTRLLPFLEFTRAYRKLFNRAAQWKSLGYNSPVGYHKFRHAIASMLGHSRSLAVEDDELCVVRGSQMALYLVAHSVLTRGDHIAIESPGYGKAYEAFMAAGMVVHPIAVDADGIDVDAVGELCRSVGLKAVYLTPRHQYPTTVKLSMSRRHRIKLLTENYGLTVIEDDFGADFQYSGSRLLPLSSMLNKTHYIYIGTFSKIFAPAIRVGYIASSVETITKIAAYRQLIDIQGDTVQERALFELMDSGAIARHVRRSSKVYRERLDFATKEIRRLLGSNVEYRKPHGGLALWLTFTFSSPMSLLCSRLRKKGIEMPMFALSDGRTGLRMGFASLSNGEISRVVEALAAVAQ
ncbi:MAG: PLP-dependent aminotransferase family protein [Prevotellaceae bacterium]|nr:PLP-dependent aminotransferase family protein [Prevotellaceae bacterium]